MDRDSTFCPAQGTMFHFLSKLRRHASLEGAGPFFSVKKWRQDTTQRAASLDTRGEDDLKHTRTSIHDLIHELSICEVQIKSFLQFSLIKRSCWTGEDVLSSERCFIGMMAGASGGDTEEFGPVSHQESLEQPSLYRDIWSLRASLEQYASSDLSSNDRDSTRSDADSVCSAGASRAAGQRRNGLDKEFRLFGSSSGKTSSVSLEADTPASVSHQEPVTKPRPHFRRRDYSIDEKTEALFNEFLRHDPQFDQQGSPSLRHRHRSRIHLRKQWQRSKQYSDPGAARYSPSLERQRCYPLRRGDSANFPLDTRYHSTLPRIASAADEEASEGAASMESLFFGCQ
uniref:CACN subunit beta associated regulatory protein b n=1 Tax=Sinocyclocheilus rhinocerous TaxID=307959 RepID=A0A673HHA4_9TELE